MISRCALLCVLLMQIGGYASADIVLRSPDGVIEFEGDLTSIDDKNFTIRTRMGSFIVPRSDVQCIGKECPKSELSVHIGLSLPTEWRDAVQTAREDTVVANVTTVSSDASAPDPTNPDVIALEAFPRLSLPSSWDRGVLIGHNEIVVAAPERARVNAVSFDALVAMTADDTGAEVPASERSPRSRPIIDPHVAADFEALVLTPVGRTLDRTLIGEQDIRGQDDRLRITTRDRLSSERVVGLEDRCGLVSKPDRFSVLAGDYPLGRVVVASRPLDDVKVAVPRSASKVVNAQGIELASMARSTDWIANAFKIDQLTQLGRQGGEPSSERLGDRLRTLHRTSLRFRAASPAATDTSLDRHNFELLLRALSAESSRGGLLLLVGHAEDDGADGSSVTPALAALENRLTAELASAGITQWRVERFDAGSKGPLICAPNDRLRQLNRRIEIWTDNEALGRHAAR